MEIAAHVTLTTAEEDDDIAKELIDLIERYGEDGYVAQIRTIIRNAVLDVASDHSTFDFFTMRETIGNEINAILEHELKLVHTVLNHFMVLSFDFPYSLNQEIQATEIVKQQQEEWEFHLTRVQVESDTKRDVATIKAQTIEDVATINGNRTYMLLEAEAQNLEAVVDQKVQTLMSIRDNFEMLKTEDPATYDPTDGERRAANKAILDYLWMQTVMLQEGSGTIIMGQPEGIPI